MNDRFRFRAWNKKHNYYDFCRRKFGILYIQEKFRVSSGYDGEDQPTFCEDVNDNYIIEQCTGLKDKNGNLIYEGDIIGDGEDDYVIKWDSNRTMFVSEDIDTSYEIEDILDPTICVIGNIHEQARQKDM